MGRKAEKLSVRRQMGGQCGWRYGEEMATPREVPAAAIHDHNENAVTTLGTFLIDDMYEAALCRFSEQINVFNAFDTAQTGEGSAEGCIL